MKQGEDLTDIEVIRILLEHFEDGACGAPVFDEIDGPWKDEDEREAADRCVVALKAAIETML